MIGKCVDDVKFSVGLWAFGACADRFCTTGYRERLSLEDRMKLASSVEEISAVEVAYPRDLQGMTIDDMKGLLDRFGLSVSMVCVDVQTDPRWKFGSVTSRDPSIRQAALGTIKEAMDVAVALKTMKVNFWPGQDGYDYPFQSDYLSSWRMITEGLRDISTYNRNVKICIEYKAKEPRTHLLIGSIGKAIMLTEAVGTENIGVTVDVGHSLMMYENVAESVALASSKGRLFHIHLNDNYRDWDHDMIAGSVHFWEFLELLLWLRVVGYHGWYSLDIFPYREDPVLACQESIDNMKWLMEIIEAVGVQDLIAAVREGRFREAYARVRRVMKS